MSYTTVSYLKVYWKIYKKVCICRILMLLKSLKAKIIYREVISIAEQSQHGGPILYQLEEV